MVEASGGLLIQSSLVLCGIKQRRIGERLGARLNI